MRKPSQTERILGPIMGIIIIVVVVIFWPNIKDYLDTGSKTQTTTSQNTAKSAATTAIPATTDLTTKPAPSALGNWEITFDSYEVVDSISASFITAFKPDDGNVYVVITLSIKNTGTTAETFLPLFALSDAIGAKIMYEKYEYTASNLMGLSDDLHYKQMNPLTTATGIVAFQVPVDIADSGELSFVLTKGSKKLTFELD